MKKLLHILVWVIALSPFVYLGWLWPGMPEKVAMHYDLHGTPDRYGNRKELIVLLAVIAVISLLIYYLLPLVYKIDPKKTAIDNKHRLKSLAIAITVFMSFISIAIISSAYNSNVKLNMQLIFGAIGLFWCIMGNYMYNIKPNYFAGFRLPWTLNNEENWRKTHWLAAKLLFGGGLLIFICAIFLPKSILIASVIAIAAISMIIPIVYSYRLFRKQKALN